MKPNPHCIKCGGTGKRALFTSVSDEPCECTLSRLSDIRLRNENESIKEKLRIEFKKSNSNPFPFNTPTDDEIEKMISSFPPLKKKIDYIKDKGI